MAYGKARTTKKKSNGLTKKQKTLPRMLQTKIMKSKKRKKM